MAQKKTKYLKQRKGNYEYYRRVPKYMAAYDKRDFIVIALNTRDESEAIKKAAIQNDAIEEFWKELIRNPNQNIQEEYKKAVNLAKIHGFAYKSIKDISEAPIGEITERLQATFSTPENKAEVAQALFGTIEQPSVKLSDCPEIFFKLNNYKIKDQNDDFIRKWKNPRNRAVNHFIDAVGNIELHTLNRQHMLDFRSWWLNKIEEENLSAGSANKDFSTLKIVLKAAALENQIDIDFFRLYQDITLENRAKQRASFEASFVQNNIINLPALKNLNKDARNLILFMADTGARVNEIIGLLPEDIVLDAEIPFIYIRPNAKRTLKTPQSEREIPLVGTALHAAKQMKKGFARYKNADSASALINKFFVAHKLKLSKYHTLYSLRHTFEDRLKDARIEEALREELMGHKYKNYNYGRGYTLDAKLEALQKIAFTPPTEN